MIDRPQRFSRRQFTTGAMAAAGAAALPLGTIVAAETAKRDRRFCAFIKFLNELSYDELAERIAEIGFSGVEATIRTNDGYIKPEHAAVELPKFKKALEKNGLVLTIVTTDILAADQKHADSVVRAAADAGAGRYRLGFFRYDLDKPIVPQVTALKSKFEAIAELSRRAGIAAVYQNHAGADLFGATIWDLYYLLKDHAPEDIGCVYDLRHAAVEAGESWPTLHAVIRPHITAYSVKDFDWSDRNQSRHAPLGEGRVDGAFYKSLAGSGFDGPVSLHVEYVEPGQPDRQLAALKRDFAVLQRWMGA